MLLSSWLRSANKLKEEERAQKRQWLTKAANFYQKQFKTIQEYLCFYAPVRSSTSTGLLVNKVIIH